MNQNDQAPTLSDWPIWAWILGIGGLAFIIGLIVMFISGFHYLALIGGLLVLAGLVWLMIDLLLD